MKTALRYVPFLHAVLIVLASTAADWPHWRGPNRNDIVNGPSGYDGGKWRLNELWQTNVGDGSTSPIVVDGKLYAMGNRNGRDTVRCLDAATGKTIWTTSYACGPYGRKAMGDQGLYRGTSSTPSFDVATGLLFTLSIDGDLHCWDTNERGRKVWHVNLYDKYDSFQRPRVGRSGHRDYGYTTSPLVQGDCVIVEVGAAEGNLMAFDKHSGRRVWASENRDPAGHTGGPVPMSVEGVACVAVFTHNHLLVARIDKGHEGETVAAYPWQTSFANSIATPAVHENFVLITAGYNHHTICKLEITLRGGARKVWEQEYCSKVCSPVIHKGHVYWCWRDVHCLDFETGQPQWIGPSGLGDPGSCIVTSDDRLVVYCDEGDLLLMETAVRSPSKPTVLARRDRLFRTDAWPHVVLADGRLYCKDRRGSLKCLAVGETAGDQSTTVAKSDPPTRPKSPDRPPPRDVGLKSWPGTAGLVLAWKAGFSQRQVVGYRDGKREMWDLQLGGQARFDDEGRLLLAGGDCRIAGASDSLLESFRGGDELCIEAVLASNNTRQAGPARIISYSTDAYHRNFTLGQERGNYILRLRTPRTGENGQRPEVTLGPVDAGKLQHLIVTYRDGELVTYINGKRINRTSDVGGDFGNWSPQHFLLGDEHDGGRDWSGALERFALLRRFIGDAEARRRHELLSGEMNKD